MCPRSQDARRESKMLGDMSYLNRFDATSSLAVPVPFWAPATDQARGSGAAARQDSLRPRHGWAGAIQGWLRARDRAMAMVGRRAAQRESESEDRAMYLSGYLFPSHPPSLT
ncbi:hypothetical protein VDGL01_00849 [Verticillium dahliae]